jgi:hypothetical protein
MGNKGGKSRPKPAPPARRAGKRRGVSGDEISRKRQEISNTEGVIRNDHGKLVREEVTLRRLQAELAALLARGNSGGGEQSSMFAGLLAQIATLRNEISGCGSNLNNLQARFNESDAKLIDSTILFICSVYSVKIVQVYVIFT